MKNKLIKIFSLIIIGIIMVNFTACGSKKPKTTFDTGANKYQLITEEKTASKTTLRDKVLGGWIGHAIGLGSGFEYVVADDGNPMIAINDKYFEPNGEICAGTLGSNPMHLGPYDPIFRRVEKGKVKSDDDILVDVFNQYILEENNMDMSYYEYAKAWKDYQIGDSAGGNYAMKIINEQNYIAPYTGQIMGGNLHYVATESWIENETLGLLFPYMPLSAEGYSEIFSTLTSDAHGIYLAKLCSIAYSYAMTESDSRVALEKAFDHMDKSDDIYHNYLFVKDYYEKNPTDWRGCVKAIYDMHQGHRLAGVNTQIALDVNAGFIFIGIIFGENDFYKATKIVSLAGYDGDCTAATVCGLVGAALGFDALPHKYKEFLNGDSVFINDQSWFSNVGNDKFPERQTFNEITDRTMRNMETHIKATGGNVEGDVYTIKAQTNVKRNDGIVENFTFRNGTTDGWQVENATLDKSNIAHTGEFGGVLAIDNPNKPSSVYTNVTGLKIGDTYRATIYVSIDPLTEYLFYAKDGKKVYSKHCETTLMTVTYFLRTDLEFVATAESMQVGIELPVQENGSGIIYFDDLSVLNISHQAATTGQLYEAEYQYMLESMNYTNDKHFSAGGYVRMSYNDKLMFKMQGSKNIFDNVRIYYTNPNHSMVNVKVFIDGQYKFMLPLLPTGEALAPASSNFTEFGYYFGEGEHEIKIEVINADRLNVDKFEVRQGSLSIR